MLSFFNWLHLIITLFCQLWNAARTSPTWMARAAGRLAMNRLSCSLKSWKRKIRVSVYPPIWHGRDPQAHQTKHPASTESRAVWKHTNHILQTTRRGTERKRNHLVTAIAKGLGKHNFLVHASLIQTALQQWLLTQSALIPQALSGLDALMGHLTTHQKMDCDHSIIFAFYYTTGIWFQLETYLGDYLAPNFSVTEV